MNRKNHSNLKSDKIFAVLKLITILKPSKHRLVWRYKILKWSFNLGSGHTHHIFVKKNKDLSKFKILFRNMYQKLRFTLRSGHTHIVIVQGIKNF